MKVKRKPGPPAYKPTATQRRRVMRGIAIGLTLEQLADDLGMAYGTMRRVFATEIKTARVRLILDNLDRLHDAADHGNVSAMKALAHMMRPHADDPEEEADDDAAWADVFPNSSRNAEIH
jgi:hypothetical protein